MHRLASAPNFQCWHGASADERCGAHLAQEQGMGAGAECGCGSRGMVQKSPGSVTHRGGHDRWSKWLLKADTGLGEEGLEFQFGRALQRVGQVVRRRRVSRQ